MDISKRFMLTFFAIFLLFTSQVSAGEVLITGFPVGVGRSANEKLFEPFYPDLKLIAAELKSSSLARAIITGRADGIQYRANNDATNTGLALGRAHALFSVLVNRFSVDSSQLIVQSVDVTSEGAEFRSVSIRVVRELEIIDTRIDTIGSRLYILETNPEPEQDMRLLIGAGLSTSPFGLMPVVTAAIDWQRIVYFEGLLGHTLWNETFSYLGSDLDTKSRLAGVQIAVYPFAKTPIGFVGGWLRTEEISQEFYEYVQLSEGLIVGLQTRPADYLTITGAFNPSKRRVVDDAIAQSRNGQFWLSVTLNTALGGQ